MPRADAFATLYFFHPIKRLSPRSDRLPILMYHSISNRQERTHPYYRTVTAPEVFAQQMQYLHENEYSTLGLAEAVKWLEVPRSDGRRPVVITFDDGFQDFYTTAFPILSRHGFGAIMFLPTAYIGNVAQAFKETDCLTWRQVRELRASGIEFGSHTVSHPQLTTLVAADAEREVRASKDTIEQELGCTVKSFAYPYAFPEMNRRFITRLRGFLEQAGYENGVSTIIGTADGTGDRFFMKRLPVNTCDDNSLLKAKLEGGYDWLHAAQYLAKLTSRRKSTSR
jgi:peptidoglycan/xylan/chitin deacetylase (PgdA/CDA1 family)